MGHIDMPTSVTIGTVKYTIDFKCVFLSSLRMESLLHPALQLLLLFQIAAASGMRWTQF